MKNVFESNQQTRKETGIKGITIPATKSGFLVIEVPVASLPNSLRSGELIAEEIKAFCEKVRRQRLAEKLERFLQRAYVAEEKRNYFRSARAFVWALYCEGMLRTNDSDAYRYVQQAMPVY
jgi:lipid A disaccharide synthetase